MSGMSTTPSETLNQQRHSLIEDTQAILTGTLMCALSVIILQHLNLVTGQTAGVAVLLSYATGWDFGLVFFMINIPFYLLAYWRIGLRFTVKTFVAVALISGFSVAAPMLLEFARIDMLTGSILAGACAGIGLLALFRHGASLGGVGVLAFYLQDRFGIRAGWTQLGFDLVIFSAAFMVIEPMKVAYSLVGAIALNLIVAINHRRDRYIAM